MLVEVLVLVEVDELVEVDVLVKYNGDCNRVAAERRRKGQTKKVMSGKAGKRWIRS